MGSMNLKWFLFAALEIAEVVVWWEGHVDDAPWNDDPNQDWLMLTTSLSGGESVSFGDRDTSFRLSQIQRHY